MAELTEQLGRLNQMRNCRSAILGITHRYDQDVQMHVGESVNG